LRHLLELRQSVRTPPIGAERAQLRQQSGNSTALTKSKYCAAKFLPNARVIPGSGRA
jgi:hypothetical protein